ncbi:hypothetical protein X011_14475 [Mycobacterium tuberculosis variant microti OV254]|nr:hypothetical protein X011_14475 [Mycobacterium tuberculosis variant microti OV254]
MSGAKVARFPPRLGALDHQAVRARGDRHPSLVLRGHGNHHQQSQRAEPADHVW